MFWQITTDGYVLAPLAGTAYILWILRTLGAKIGKNCAIWAGGQMGTMTEPGLVEVRLATKLYLNVLIANPTFSRLGTMSV